MSLRAQVEALLTYEQGGERYCNVCDAYADDHRECPGPAVLALIPEDAILVTRESLAAALQKADGVQGFGGQAMAEAWADAIIAAIREE